jgi:hypothetical protein
MPHDVFISYATEDKVTADAVCARLEQQDVRCWIAPRDIVPGVAWKASIVNAIQEARALVLVFTARSNASSEVAKEIAQAAQHGLSIITFRMEDVPLASALKYDLDAIHWLDAITPPVERHIDQLAAKLHVVLDRGPVRDQQPTLATPPPQASGRSAGLLAAFVVACLVASAAVGWILFSGDRSGDRETTVANGTAAVPAPVPLSPRPVPQDATATGPVEAGAATRPNAAKAARVPVTEPVKQSPAPRDPPPPQESRAAPPAPVVAPLAAQPAAPVARSADDGFIGCWTYNGLHLSMSSDGVVTGFLGGRWVASGTNEFVITWPPSTDTVVLSADGQSLAGSNNYAGANLSSRRVSGAPGELAGSWSWSMAGGQIAVFHEDRRAVVGTIVGAWSELRERTFRIVWEYRFVDRVSLSPDRRTLTGRNQLGQPITGTRVTCAG